MSATGPPPPRLPPRRSSATRVHARAPLCARTVVAHPRLVCSARTHACSRAAAAAMGDDAAAPQRCTGVIFDLDGTILDTGARRVACCGSTHANMMRCMRPASAPAPLLLSLRRAAVHRTSGGRGVHMRTGTPRRRVHARGGGTGARDAATVAALSTPASQTSAQQACACASSCIRVLADALCLIASRTAAAPSPQGRGLRPLEACAAVVSALSLPLTPAELYAATDGELSRRWGEAELMPGASRLLRHLHASGVRLALATSTPHEVLALKKQSLGDLFGLFSAVVAGDDVAEGKPAPDAYLAAAAALGLPASACLAIEDAPSGVASARAAGCAVLAVPSLPERAAYAGERTTLLCSLLDVDLARWGLPQLDDWVARALPLAPLMRLKGPVVHGFGRGSKLLGIPTANLDTDVLGPAIAHAACSGIYIGWASVGHDAAVHKAVLSIGWHVRMHACVWGRACMRR